MVDGRLGGEVRDIVRDVIAETAPNELPLVDGLRQFDDDTAVRRLRKARSSDDPLGFGLGEVVASLTPVVWLALDEVGRRMVGAAVDTTVTRAKRKLFRRRSEPVRVPALTSQQLADVRRRVIESAIHDGVDPEQAERLADAVVARLALDDAE
jgi:hypothetical protein